MKKTDKEIIISNLTEAFASGDYFYFTDTAGLTVEEVNKLRRTCFERGIKMQVAKNTLIKKAMQAAGKYREELDQVLAGPTSILFSDTGNAPAKMITDVRKNLPKPVIKGAFIDNDIFLGDDQLETLAKLKSKQELIGEVIGLLQSPARNVISALQSGGHTIAGIVKTLQERAA